MGIPLIGPQLLGGRSRVLAKGLIHTPAPARWLRKPQETTYIVPSHALGLGPAGEVGWGDSVPGEGASAGEHRVKGRPSGEHSRLHPAAQHTVSTPAAGALLYPSPAHPKVPRLPNLVTDSGSSPASR